MKLRCARCEKLTEHVHIDMDWWFCVVCWNNDIGPNLKWRDVEEKLRFIARYPFQTTDFNIGECKLILSKLKKEAGR